MINIPTYRVNQVTQVKETQSGVEMLGFYPAFNDLVCPTEESMLFSNCGL